MIKFKVEKVILKVGDQRLGNCRVCKEQLQRFGFYFKLYYEEDHGWFTAACSENCTDYFIMSSQ